MDLHVLSVIVQASTLHKPNQASLYDDYNKPPIDRSVKPIPIMPRTSRPKKGTSMTCAEYSLFGGVRFSVEGDGSNPEA